MCFLWHPLGDLLQYAKSLVSCQVISVLCLLQPQVEVTDADRRQEEQMRATFRRISGSDMEIDAYELQEILNAAFRQGNTPVTLLGQQLSCVGLTFETEVFWFDWKYLNI